MSQSPPASSWTEVLRPLESDAGVDSGVGPPRAWLLDRAHFVEQVKTTLPPSHALRALLKHARGERAEERCARAYDRLRGGTLPEAVTSAVRALWHEHGASLGRGLDVEARLEVDGASDPEAVGRTRVLRPPLARAVVGAEATSAAIARAWAWLALHAVVEALGAIGARDAALSIVLHADPVERAADLPAPPEDPAVARPSSGSEARAEPGEPAPSRELGIEIVLGRADGPRLTPASASVALPLAREALAAGLEVLGYGPPRGDGWLRASERGVALDARQLAQTLGAAPARGAELGLLGLGVADARALGGIDAEQERLGAGLRRMRIGLAAARSALRVQREHARVEPALAQEVAALGAMDLGLLPNDATPTTLEHTLGVLRRAVGAWARALAAELALHAALGAVIRRRVPEAPTSIGTMLARGGAGSGGAGLAVALEILAERLRADRPARALVCAGRLRQAGDLPAGAARTLLAEFLADHAELALGPFELATPRWGEDAAELGRLLAVLLAAPPPADDAAKRSARVRADAEGELARYEPKLSRAERGASRLLRDHARALARGRRVVGRTVLAALGALRRILLDIGRRLGRIEGHVPPDGALLCRVAELQRALAAELPELGPLIRMRAAERALAAEWSAERAVPPAELEAELHGIGSSPGVVEGPVRVVRGAFPAANARGQVVVIAHADPAACPLYLGVAALVVESGGLFAPAAETARELGLPAVMGVAGACSLLRDGTEVRVDGERGTVERLRQP